MNAQHASEVSDFPQSAGQTPSLRGGRPHDLLCTLVLPTYNAAGFIERSVDRLNDFLAENPQWCVLFVCDGCSDDTPAILDRLLEGRSPRMRVRSYPVNRGKGYAIRTGLSLAETPYRIFSDVDLAYAPSETTKVLRLLQDGADVAVVNRASPDSRFLISPTDFPRIYKRHRMSRAFNWYLRQMLPITIRDTQAGLKGVTADAWQRLAPQLKSDGFFIDVEMLAYAGKAGMRVAETPVNFDYVDPSTVRLVSHGGSMIVDTFKLRRRLRREGYSAPAAVAKPAVAVAARSLMVLQSTWAFEPALLQL